MYHVLAINERTGKRVKLNNGPLTHAEACLFMSRFTNYPWRRLLLVDA